MRVWKREREGETDRQTEWERGKEKRGIKYTSEKMENKISRNKTTTEENKNGQTTFIFV